MSQPRNRNEVYLVDSYGPTGSSKRVMLSGSDGQPPSQPNVEVDGTHLTLGCYRISREAFKFLSLEWDEFLVNGSSKRLQ